MERDNISARCGSPVHIHVDDSTPVHVHVKKDKPPSHGSKVKAKTPSAVPAATAVNRMSSSAESIFQCIRQPAISSSNEVAAQKSVVGQFSNTAIPSTTHWVPPPAKTSKPNKYMWQGSTNKLNADDMQPQSALEVQADLDSDVEDRIQVKMRQYEKRIEALMEQVSELKKETKAQNKNQNCGCNVDCSEDGIGGSTSTERLLQQLATVDRQTDEVCLQMKSLADALQTNRKQARRSCDIAAANAAVAHNRHLLLNKMTALDTSCRQLRRMLIEQRNQSVQQQQIVEHRQQLLDQVVRLEQLNEMLKKELYEKETQISELKILCNLRRDEVADASELHGSLELSKSQLQARLRQRDIDCSQMALELRNLQNQLSQERTEVENLRQLLSSGSGKVDYMGRKTSRKSGRKQDGAQSSCCDDELQQPVTSETFRIETSSLRSYCDKLVGERKQALDELAIYKVRVGELETIINRLSADTKKDQTNLSARLHDKISEVSAITSENEQLQNKLSTLELRLGKASDDVNSLQAKVSECEQTIDEYRSQLTRSRRETEDALCRLEESRREVSQLRSENDVEIDRVKQHMQNRLTELEPLPELLRSSETRLRQATEQLQQYMKLNMDNTRTINELNAKIEKQNEFEIEKRDLLRQIAGHEETVHKANVQMQEMMRDNSSMRRRLDALVADNQRKLDLERDKLSARERAQRAQILDLETQLTQVQGEVIRLKHDKDEAERRFNSQMYDLRDRLEQSHSTNRSLQNYVEFLKNSYTTVFADHVFTPTAAAAVTPTVNLATTSTLRSHIV